MLTVCLTSWLFTDIAGNMSVASAATLAPTKLPVPGVSYTLKQFLKQGKAYKASDAPLVLSNAPHTAPPAKSTATQSTNAASLTTAQPPTMKAARQQITASLLHASAVPASLASNTVGNAGSASPLHIIGSDAGGVRLEVIIPVGALDLSHATTTKGTAPRGTLTVSLTQLSGYFLGMTTELGEFQVQVTDAQGLVVHGIKLRAPATFIFHYRNQELQRLDLDPAHMLMTWPTLIASNSKGTTKSAQTATSPAVMRMQNNTAASTLTAQSSVLDSA